MLCLGGAWPYIIVFSRKKIVLSTVSNSHLLLLQKLTQLRPIFVMSDFIAQNIKDSISVLQKGVGFSLSQ